MATEIELWQAEWCPSSHRVRQRLTELGLTFTARQVPAQPEARVELKRATGHTTIPILIVDGEIIVDDQAILAYLDERFTEPQEAEQHRAKAITLEREELEEAQGRCQPCPQ